MNKLIIISIFFLLSFGSAIQAEGENLSKKQTELIKNQVDSIFQQMLILAENLDYDELNSGVDDTRGAGFIANNKYYSQYASLIEDLKLNAQGVGQQDITIEEKKTTVLSDKIVLMTVFGVSSAILDDGREISANFHWSFVYEKIDGSWKVIYSHQSTTG